MAHGRRYFRCPRCALTHLHPADRLSIAEERAHYLTHENDPADPGYRAFLARLADPVASSLSPGAEGLDYGSGPGPTLSLMLEERGFVMSRFDPFFDPAPDALRRDYDFIVCSETAEHFFNPAEEFDRLRSLLRPGGLMGLMTEPRPGGSSLQGWWYTRDPTHVSFYAPETVAWIADRFGWALTGVAPAVTLFRDRRPLFR